MVSDIADLLADLLILSVLPPHPSECSFKLPGLRQWFGLNPDVLSCDERLVSGGGSIVDV